MRKGELSIKNHEDATQNNKNTLISSILPYDVLRLIFEYLNSRDLTNAAMVCRSWLEAANDEKSTRLNPCFISSNEDSDLLNHLIKNLRIEPSFCFCFTWVTVLRKECNTEERIEARLKLFKNEVKLKKHSLGFMFASLHRNIKTNVESTIFKRLFPKIPLVGMNNFFKFKLSNICDKLNNEKNIHKEHESERSEFCYYCTIFLILTYG
ncbi:uncharacterized protein [Mycetomoellerius zeteki]|uniref:uncharacterized protein n=1 Tax=Mycetomoellerius zeteki TaxID=64791 RepID=UPI00084ECBE0|nr:PREDICTED: uncharacterized protein LOC108721845 [Trachymyrmex zeteki]